MEQEEAAVEAVAVKGGAGNDLPQFSFSMIFHLKGTLSRYSSPIIGLSHGFLSSGSILLRTKLKNDDRLEKRVRLVQGLFPGDLFDGSITELPDIAFNDGPVGSHRIFFPMGLVAIDPNFGCFG